MEWFDSSALRSLFFLLWTNVAVLALPRWVENSGIVAIVALLGGFVTLFGFVSLLDLPPVAIMVYALAAVVVALVAVLHSEILARRRLGYWRFVGPRSD